MDEWKILRDLSERWPKAIFYVFSGIFKWQNAEVTKSIQTILDNFDISKVTIKEIHSYIGNVCREVDKILNKSKLFRVKWKKLILEQVQYRTFVYWILDILKQSWVDISEEVPKDVPDELGREIYHILRDKELTTLFIVLKSYGLLDYSKNITNKFDIESELKILDVDTKLLIENLEKLGGEKVFEGKIEDLYFDYQDRRFDKDQKEERSFRIRKRKDYKDGKKKSDYFYTLKRKEAREKGRVTRDAFEKEYKIHGFDQFYKIIEAFGLKPYRAKVKERISYSIPREHIKFDIDMYHGIPALLEIECDNEETVRKYIELLWLSDNKQLRTGSRGLFKHYEILSDYIFADNDNKKFSELVDKFKEKWGSLSDNEAQTLAAAAE